MLRINTRLRPIRLGFVTNIKDRKTLFKIFQINSCLWGGIYNPIIPYSKRTSKEWQNRITNPKFQKFDEIFNAYIDFFEPDFLVVPEELEETFGFDEERILKLETILSKNQNHRYGLNASVIYQYLYENKYHIINKHSRSVIYPDNKTNKNNLLNACLIGSFPQDYPYIKNSYGSIFNPDLTFINNEFLEKFSAGEYLTPLEINQFEITSCSNHNYNNPQIFLIESSTLDLIDFWNFRSIYPNIILLPYKNAISSPYLLKKVIQNLQKVKSIFPPNIMFSRSISALQEKELSSQIKSLGENCTLQRWFPPFWEDARSIDNQYPRLTISHDSDFSTIESEIKDPSKIKLKTIYPKFSEKSCSKFACANVFEIETSLFGNNIALTQPINPKDSSFLDLIWHTLVLSTTEGLIIFSDCFSEKHHFKLNTGSEVFKKWFDKQKIKITLSSAGKFTEQILRTLPCLAAIGSICYKDIIVLLNKMASSSIKSLDCKNFRDMIKRATNAGKVTTCHPFKNIVEHKVVKVGENIKCTLCNEWNWYALIDLKEELLCSFCSRTYEFPIYERDNSELIHSAYKVIGPFSRRHYAQGGYSAALSIAFFQFIADGDNVLWSAGLEFDFENDKKCEVDFVLLFQQKRNYQSSTFPITIFGEAKSFGKNAITKDEIQKLKILVKKFPGSAIVISTLRSKSELTKKELQILRQLSLWGRKFDIKSSQLRCPVIILTGDELFNMFSSEILEKIEYFGPSKIYSLAIYTQYKNLCIPETYVNIGPIKRLRNLQESIN